MQTYFYPALQDVSIEIRIFRDSQDRPWWVAMDVCKALGLTNVGQAISRLPDNEKETVELDKLLHIISNDVQIDPKLRHLTLVNEPGLYRLIFASRKPEAEKFKTWVFTEVLPAIHKTGKYEARKTQTPPKRIARKASEIEKLEKIVEVRREKPKHEKGMPFPELRVRWLAEKDLEKERKQARGVDAQHRQHVKQLKKEQDEAMKDATEAELRTFKLAKGAGRHL